MKITAIAAFAAITLGAASPALAAGTWLFGDSPTDSQLLIRGTRSAQATQMGWFNANGFHIGGNSNYLVGNIDGLELRNFFSFRPGGFARAASLEIGNLGGVGDGGGFNPGTGSTVTWTLYDLATTIDSDQTYSDVSIFNDLGTGTVYGSVTVGSATSLVTVALNAAGIQALNRAVDGGFAFNVGGALSFDAAVPEPASWAMMIAGFGLVGAAMRRRSAALAA